jgi:hypothetical protein
MQISLPLNQFGSNFAEGNSFQERLAEEARNLDAPVETTPSSLPGFPHKYVPVPENVPTRSEVTDLHSPFSVPSRHSSDSDSPASSAW